MTDEPLPGWSPGAAWQLNEPGHYAYKGEERERWLERKRLRDEQAREREEQARHWKEKRERELAEMRERLKPKWYSGIVEFFWGVIAVVCGLMTIGCAVATIVWFFTAGAHAQLILSVWVLIAVLICHLGARK